MKRLAKKLIRLPSQMAGEISVSWDNVTSKKIPYKKLVIQEIQGEILPETNNTLCVFAHYDRHGYVQPYVRYYLESLREMGISILFVTTSELKPEHVDVIQPIVSHIIVRRNIGLDFGSWNIGLKRTGDLSNYKRLVLANDSVYGPLFNLKKIFHDMDQKDVDIWGITDSWEDSWHLHSYFLVLNQTALRSAFFEEFWGDFRYIKQKSNVINSYEIGFSGRAREAGLRCSAYCDYSLVLEDFLNNPIFRDEWTGQKARVEKFSRKPHNSSHFFWATMIKNFDCPFLKVELLRDNPSSVPDVSHWRSIISQFTDYDPSLIEQHLKMSGLHLEEG